MISNTIPIRQSPKFPPPCAQYLLNPKSARSASINSATLPKFRPDLDKVCVAGPTNRYYWSKGFPQQKLLGTGYTASVYKGFDAQLGDSVAIKYISKANQRLLATDDYFRTLYKRVKSCTHRNLLRIRDFYESEDSFYVISDLCTGPDLVDFILHFKPRTLPADCIKHIMFQILSALNYLHSRHIIHRDIKLDNILFMDPSYKELKIVDFDMAMMLNHAELPRAPRSPEEIFVVGTKDYMAPENYYGEYSEASDLWSVGVMMYIFFDGHFPFDLTNSNMGRKNRETLCKGIKLIPELRSKHPLATDLMLKLLRFNIHERICTTTDALNHPWFREQLGISEKLNGALKLSLYANKHMAQLKLKQQQQKEQQQEQQQQQKEQQKQQQKEQQAYQQRQNQRQKCEYARNLITAHKNFLIQQKMNQPPQQKMYNNYYHYHRPIISSTPLPVSIPPSIASNNIAFNSKKVYNIQNSDLNVKKNSYLDYNASPIPIPEENKNFGFNWHNNTYNVNPPPKPPSFSFDHYSLLNASASVLSNNSTIASSREFRDRIKKYLSNKK